MIQVSVVQDGDIIVERTYNDYDSAYYAYRQFSRQYPSLTVYMEDVHGGLLRSQ